MSPRLLCIVALSVAGCASGGEEAISTNPPVESPAAPPEQATEVAVAAPARPATIREVQAMEAAIRQAQDPAHDAVPHHHGTPPTEADYTALLETYETASSPRIRQETLIRYLGLIQELPERERSARMGALLVVQQRALANSQEGN
jgi:hypothetical protein